MKTLKIDFYIYVWGCPRKNSLVTFLFLLDRMGTMKPPPAALSVGMSHSLLLQHPGASVARRPASPAPAGFMGI